jgi:hypothetical protein
MNNWPQTAPLPPPASNGLPEHHTGNKKANRRRGPSQAISRPSVPYLRLESAISRIGSATPRIKTEGAWGFSPTKSRPPVFREIKYAAKPRSGPTIQPAPRASYDSPRREPGEPRPPVFREIKCAAKPRTNLAPAPSAPIEPPEHRTGKQEREPAAWAFAGDKTVCR